MTDKMKLQQYFQQASDRPLAFSEQQLRQMLSSADAATRTIPQYDTPSSVASRALRVLGVGLTIAALGTIVFDPAGIDSPVISKLSNRSIADKSTAVPQPSTPLAPTTNATDPATVTESSGDAASDEPYAPLAPKQVPVLNVTGTTVFQTADSTSATKLGFRRLSDGQTAYGYFLTTAELGANSDRSPFEKGFGDSMLVQTIGRNGLGERMMSRADFPLSVVSGRMMSVANAWQVVTDQSGRLLNERVSVRDADQLQYIATMFARGAESTEISQKLSSIRGLDALGQSLRLNTLLPIRVDLAEAANGIFWCRPTPQLIAALPAHTVAQLRDELERQAGVVNTRDTLAVVRRGWALSVLATIDSIVPSSVKLETPLDIQAQGMTGAELFAGSRHKAGAVSRFEPTMNPVKVSTTLNLELTQPRRVTVTLHDVNGRKIKTLLATTEYDEGASEITATLAGIESGLYLIAISTDQREQVVQRLVIEK